MRPRVVATILVAACPLALAGTASAAYTTVVRNPYAVQPQQHPSNFALSQDGSLELSKLKWVGWGSGTATGIGIDTYRLWPEFRFAHAAGTIQLTRRTICGRRIYYARAVATVTSMKYGATKPHTSAETLDLLPPDC